jgi:hypothetical protein
MAKRFTDTTKWGDPWFSELDSKDKLLWIYVLDTCDHAGIYKHSKKLTNFHTEKNLTSNQLCELFKDRCFLIADDVIFIPKFLRFQYPNGIESKMPALVSVRKRLDSMGLSFVYDKGLDNPYETLIEDLNNTCQSIKDKDLDMDMDMNKSKSKDNNKEKPNLANDFETFWTKTNFPKRPQDTKGDIKKKYLACIKAGLTPEDILFASDVFAEVNQGNQFSIGLRKFMEVETVREYLTENVKLKVDSKPMSKADRTMQAMNEMLREIDEREENKDDEDDDLQLAGF